MWTIEGVGVGGRMLMLRRGGTRDNLAGRMVGYRLTKVVI